MPLLGIQADKRLEALRIDSQWAGRRPADVWEDDAAPSPCHSHRFARRLNWYEVESEGTKAPFGVHHYLATNTDPPEQLVRLAFRRVSPIDGCAHAIDMDTRDLLKSVPVSRMALIPIWTGMPNLFLGRRIGVPDH